jgi:hypothetical protein
MEMPKPGESHKQMAAFIGEWSGPETMHPSPWMPGGGTRHARVSNRWIVDGFAVAQEYEQLDGDAVTFRGHGVLWFDPSRQDYVMHWWDSMGGSVNEFRGSFQGGAFTLGSAMPQGGFSRAVWRFGPEGTYAFSMDVSMDGQNWKPSIEGSYTRRTTTQAPGSRVARRAAKPAKKAAAKPAKKSSMAKKAKAKPPKKAKTAEKAKKR